MSTGTTARELRRAARRATFAPSTMRVDGTRAIDVVVHDISETGIRFASTTTLAIGDEITIGLAGVGSTRGFVAWRRGDQYGCDFLVPIGSDAAARAFNGDTVVRFGAGPLPAEVPAPAPAPAVPASLDDQVDALYARHRRWAFPRDVSLAGVALVLIAAAMLWPHL